MRTIKALACAAVLAAGLATSMAQVYSLNVVGYYNVPCAAGAPIMIANQLNTTNNTIGSLIASPPPGSFFYKFTGAWNSYQFDVDDLTWYPDANATLNPGEAGMFKAAAATTLTFVGEVLQGNLSYALPTAGSPGTRASIVPQAGSLTTQLSFPAEPGDFAYKFTGAWNSYQFDVDDLTWYPTEPTFGVGEGLMVKKAVGGTAAAWARNFTVQ